MPTSDFIISLVATLILLRYIMLSYVINDRRTLPSLTNEIITGGTCIYMNYCLVYIGFVCNNSNLRPVKTHSRFKFSIMFQTRLI